MATTEEVMSNLRKRNDEIAEATLRWLSERGYGIMWDGEFFIPYEQGISKDNDTPTRFKYRDRVDAYLKALELALK